MIHLARSPNIRYMNQVNAHEIMKIKSAIMGTCKGIGKSNFPIKIKIGPYDKIMYDIDSETIFGYFR